MIFNYSAAATLFTSYFFLIPLSTVMSDRLIAFILYLLVMPILLQVNITKSILCRDDKIISALSDGSASWIEN